MRRTGGYTYIADGLPTGTVLVLPEGNPCVH